MSEIAKRKFAVILRGPPAIGKSSVTKLLAAKILPGSTKRIDLDDGWGKDQNRRFPPGERRYADLKTPEDLLVLELGCGEPGGGLLGATLNPREWVSILESEGRQIHAFLLWTDYETWQKRLLVKVPEGDPGAHHFYKLFERDEWKRFPTAACQREEHIDTTAISKEAVAELIWARIQHG
jgi:hypothetical protein